MNLRMAARIKAIKQNAKFSLILIMTNLIIVEFKWRNSTRLRLPSPKLVQKVLFVLKWKVSQYDNCSPPSVENHQRRELSISLRKWESHYRTLRDKWANCTSVFPAIWRYTYLIDNYVSFTKISYFSALKYFNENECNPSCIWFRFIWKWKKSPVEK